MNAVPIRPLTRDEIGRDAFLPLLREAAEVDADALARIRDVELRELEVVGAVDRGVVAGFAAYHVEPALVTLEYIAVTGRQRGSGLGRRLVDAVRRARPDLPLHAETDDDAVGFYRGLGFEIAAAPRDSRWPTRQRYLCAIVALTRPPS